MTATKPPYSRTAKEPTAADPLADLDRRDARALTEVMSVLDEQDPRVAGADDLYLVVSASGREYLVDAREGVCECPDFEYNLPTADGRRACKHIARVTYETGMRPIPSWVDRGALDDQIGMHVHATPRVARAGVATDGGAAKAETDAATDADADAAADRPADCSCVPTDDHPRDGGLPCWPCWRAGFRSPNPAADAESDR